MLGATYLLEHTPMDWLVHYDSVRRCPSSGSCLVEGHELGIFRRVTSCGSREDGGTVCEYATQGAAVNPSNTFSSSDTKPSTDLKWYWVSIIVRLLRLETQRWRELCLETEGSGHQSGEYREAG